MNGFDGDRLVRDLGAAATPQARFEALTLGLSVLGLDTVNYGFFDARAAELASTDIQFMTTMSADWMDHYVDDQLAATDIHVARVQAGRITPYVWGESIIQRVEPQAERATALEGVEAGLRSALCVPLTSPLDPFSPVAGIVLGSSMDERAFGQVMHEHGTTLLSIAYLFHNASIRQLWRTGADRVALSTRERDCLQYLANGRRQDAIAHTLKVARVTVEAHLRSARKKLGAQTLSEAVAKALMFGEISSGR